MEDFRFPIIDMKSTGQKIKMECQRQNYTVKDIQKYLGLGSFQSVYNWFSGKALPSLDHMFALSRLLGKTMEELIVCGNIPMEDHGQSPDEKCPDRFWRYWRSLPAA